MSLRHYVVFHERLLKSVTSPTTRPHPTNLADLAACAEDECLSLTAGRGLLLSLQDLP